MRSSAGASGGTASGTPEMRASGRPTIAPTIITHASTTRDPIIRLERDEARVAIAHRTAAPRPPMMAVTRPSLPGGGVRRRARLSGVVRECRVLPSAFAPGALPVPCRPAYRHPHTRSFHLAKTPRTWTGARTPSGLKRVRQASRRHDVLGPRRSAAKTYVAKALTVAGTPGDSEAATVALIEALSALDRAAKAGAIHPNAAARRKSRLTIKVNAALGGAHVQAGGKAAKQTGKAAAAKAAKARIAASKSVKAKGAQTAAGKARAAFSKTARAEAAEAKAAESAAA